MSTRAHFWLRVGGITLILIAQFFPRIASQSASTHDAKAEAAAIAKR